MKIVTEVRDDRDGGLRLYVDAGTYAVYNKDEATQIRCWLQANQGSRAFAYPVEPWRLFAAAERP